MKTDQLKTLSWKQEDTFSARSTPEDGHSFVVTTLLQIRVQPFAASPEILYNSFTLCTDSPVDGNPPSPTPHISLECNLCFQRWKTSRGITRMFLRYMPPSMTTLWLYMEAWKKQQKKTFKMHLLKTEALAARNCTRFARECCPECCEHSSKYQLTGRCNACFWPSLSFPLMFAFHLYTSLGATWWELQGSSFLSLCHQLNHILILAVQFFLSQ